MPGAGASSRVMAILLARMVAHLRQTSDHAPGHCRPHSHRPALTRPAGIRSGRCTPPSGRQPGHGAASLSGRAAAGVQMISSVRQLSPHAPSLPGANARTGRCNTDGRASFQDRRHRQGKGSCHDQQPGQCLQADTPAASGHIPCPWPAKQAPCANPYVSVSACQ